MLDIRNKPLELRYEPQLRTMMGEVYSYTVVQDPPAGYDAPYTLALVKLDDGRIITAQLTDMSGAVAIGDRVEVVTRKLTSDGEKGIIVYGFKFRKLVS